MPYRDSSGDPKVSVAPRRERHGSTPHHPRTQGKHGTSAATRGQFRERTRDEGSENPRHDPPSHRGVYIQRDPWSLTPE